MYLHVCDVRNFSLTCGRVGIGIEYIKYRMVTVVVAMVWSALSRFTIFVERKIMHCNETNQRLAQLHFTEISVRGLLQAQYRAQRSN